MKVLITGGAGYVGGAVTDLLKETTHEFRVLDNLMYEESYRKNVNFVHGDTRDEKLMLEQLKWADAVIWLSAVVGDGACAVNPELTEEINQENVKWLSENFDGRILFTSTCSVYGAQDGLLDEESPLNPLSVYAATKRDAEKYLVNKNALVCRLGTLFGVSDEFSRIRLDLVVNTMGVRAATEGRIKVFGGEQWRPLLHVRDIAKVLVDNLETTHTGVFNIHTVNMKMLDLANIIKSYYPDLIVDVVDMKFEDSRNYKVKSDKAIATLGFKPQYTVEQGVEQLKSILLEHRIKNVNNPLYTNEGYLKMFKDTLEYQTK